MVPGRRGTYIFVLVVAILFTVGGLFAKEKPTQNPFELADSYFKTKEYSKAREVYRDIYLSDPHGKLSEDALFRVIKCDGNLKRYEEVRLNLGRFMKAYKDSRYLDEANFLMGVSLMNLRRPEDADRYFGKVRGGLKAQAALFRAYMAVSAGQYKRTELFMKYTDGRIYENDPRALLIRAELLSVKGRKNDALDALDHIPEKALEDEAILLRKAKILNRLDKLVDAKEICNKIAGPGTMSIRILEAKKLLFTIYEKEGRTTQALSLADQLAIYMPDTFKLKVSGMFEKRGDLNNAFRYISYLRSRSAISKEMKRLLSQLMKDPRSEAVRFLVRYAGYIDYNEPFLVEICQWFVDRGMLEDARRHLVRAIRGKNRQHASLVMADYYSRKGLFEKADKYLEYVIYDMRFAWDALRLKSRIMEREKNYGAAIALLEKAIRIRENQEVYEKIGDLYWLKGEKHRALKQYVKAIDKGGKRSLIKAGDCNFIMGKKGRAVKYYARALKVKGLDAGLSQWVKYQYGKLTGKRGFLENAADEGGVVGEISKIMLMRDEQ